MECIIIVFHNVPIKFWLVCQRQGNQSLSYRYTSITPLTKRYVGNEEHISGNNKRGNKQIYEKSASFKVTNKCTKNFTASYYHWLYLISRYSYNFKFWWPMTITHDSTHDSWVLDYKWYKTVTRDFRPNIIDQGSIHYNLLLRTRIFYFFIFAVLKRPHIKC